MNIHDSGYKKLFSNRTIVRQLIETFVDQDWVSELDFDTCETLEKSFVSDHYKETESDLIYKVQLRGKTIFIYLLLEFQSTVDPFMALRVLNYLTNFYMDFCSSYEKVKRLPAIFPIVLYNGDKRWDAPTSISDLIEEEPDLGRFSLAFQYFKIAENEFGKDTLLRIRNIVSTLFLAESHFDIDLLMQELIGIFEKEDDKQAVSLLINWFRQMTIHGRIDANAYQSLEKIYCEQEEVRSMLATAIEKEKKRTFREGELKGELKGKLESRLDHARNMLREGLDLDLIGRITGLPREEIEKLK